MRAKCPVAILLAKLDRKGIEVSSGSACGSGSVKPSPILQAIGILEVQNLSTLRISFGRSNSFDEVTSLVSTLSNITHV